MVRRVANKFRCRRIVFDTWSRVVYFFPPGNKSRGAPQTLRLSHVFSSPRRDSSPSSGASITNLFLRSSLPTLLPNYPSPPFVATRDNDDRASNFGQTLKNRARPRFERGYNLFIQVLLPESRRGLSCRRSTNFVLQFAPKFCRDLGEYPVRAQSSWESSLLFNDEFSEESFRVEWRARDRSIF